MSLDYVLTNLMAKTRACM
jgi:hypothetical protein